MEHTHTEAAVRESGGDRSGGFTKKRPLKWLILLLAAVIAAYLGLCAYAVRSDAIWRGVHALGQDLGGLTVDEAAQTLADAAPGLEIGVYLYPEGGETDTERGEPDAVVALSSLNAKIDARALAQGAYDRCGRNGSFFTAGWRYVMGPGVFYGGSPEMAQVADADARACAEQSAQALSWPARDTSYELKEGAIAITAAQDGRTADGETLQTALERGFWAADLTVDVPYTAVGAKTLTAREIYDTVSGEMKNAGYDAAADAITPERIGAEFDAAAAQSLLDDAAPGETVSVPAQVEFPAVTEADLRAVLFRDVLGSATTHVGGTAARISNVKLASSSVNGVVLNCGDVFSYNAAVGQRTAAKGYQPAPAYVKGETVDEIGGGVCQPSSTLYLACLNADLEITERYAHRYAPSYIKWGMDATVSWNGPDYKFTNNTSYPIKIVTTYSKGYLTIELLGTKTDSTSVKMTNKVLSTTAWETVYQDDPTLAAGTEQVKVTPYTGYKVESYRNLYDGDGNLLSSHLEAVSDYKVRNKLVLKGPAVETPPDGGGETPLPAGGEAELPPAPENSAGETAQPAPEGDPAAEEVPML